MRWISDSESTNAHARRHLKITVHKHEFLIVKDPGKTSYVRPGPFDFILSLPSTARGRAADGPGQAEQRAIVGPRHVRLVEKSVPGSLTARCVPACVDCQ